MIPKSSLTRRGNLPFNGNLIWRQFSTHRNRPKVPLNGRAIVAFFA